MDPFTLYPQKENMLFIARYCYHYYTITFSLAELNNICWNSTADVGLYCNTPHDYLQNIAIYHSDPQHSLAPVYVCPETGRKQPSDSMVTNAINYYFN